MAKFHGVKGVDVAARHMVAAVEEARALEMWESLMQNDGDYIKAIIPSLTFLIVGKGGVRDACGH